MLITFKSIFFNIDSFLEITYKILEKKGMKIV